MGNVLRPMIVPMVTMAAQALSHYLLRPPDIPNPTVADIEIRHRAEQTRRRAELGAKEARVLADRVRRQADRDREQASAREEEANRAAVRAAAEIERMEAQIARAERAARRAREGAEEAERAAREDAQRFAREAEREHERSHRMQERAERAIAAAREEVERTRKVADEQRREAEARKVLAEEAARAAAAEIENAIEVKEEAERCLKQGIQPVLTPSPQELAAAKRRVQYREDCFHFAIAGISGSGKSSLVNAFRGLHSQDAGAAAVGVTETTLQMTRYPDAHPENPFVWYDIPGAGTLKCRDWQYFNDQGLFVFDCIIVLFDNRFTMTDIAILVNARRFNIPTYIVRSKADQHIRNVMKENGYDSEDDDETDVVRRNRFYKVARKQFIEETRNSVRTNLVDAKLPDQRVYIVSSGTMLSVVKNKLPEKTIDEVDLVNDLLKQAYSRRVTQSDEMISTRTDTRSIR